MNQLKLLPNFAIAGAVGTISVIGLGINHSSAQAAVVTNGCAAVDEFCTFPELLSGASIQIDNVLLTDWNIVSNNSVNLNNLEVGQFFDNFFNVFARNQELFIAGFGASKGLSYEFQVTSLAEDIDGISTGLGFRRVVGPTSIITGNTIFGTTQGSNDLGSVDSIFRLGQNLPGGTIEVPELNNLWVRNTLSLSTNFFGNSAQLSATIPPFGEGDASRFSVSLVEIPVTTPEPNMILSFMILGGLFLTKNCKNKFG